MVQHMLLRKLIILFALLSCFAPQSLSAQSEIVISGDVQSVDPSAGVITINHEANQRLGVERSTDKFRVSEPIMLNAIRPGARIRFAADRVNGELTITKLLAD
jgi:Cu(I)/Ag(I) efflux system periplasmic protein CusF